MTMCEHNCEEACTSSSEGYDDDFEEWSSTSESESEDDDDDDDDGQQYIFDWVLDGEGPAPNEQDGEGADVEDEDLEPQHACCGLCGVPICSPYPDKSEYRSGVDSNGNPYDWPPRDIEAEDRLAEAEEKETGECRLKKPEVDWLKNVRLLGYLTDDLVECELPICRKGDRFSFVSDLADGCAGGVEFIQGIFIDLGTETDCVPIHDSCCLLLKHALDTVRERRGYSGDVQVDVFVGYLLEQRERAFEGSPSLHDIGGVQHFLSDDYCWLGNQTSHAWYLTDFMDCEGLDKYCEQLPLPPQDQLVPATTTPLRMDNPESAFNKLPCEVLMEILCLLPVKDAGNLRIASRTAAAVPLPQEFWKWRLLEVPYLWELRRLWVKSSTPGNLDWRRLYAELLAKDPKTPELRGFRNRKRVWKIALRAAEESWKYEYLERRKNGSFTAKIAQKLELQYLWAADGRYRYEYYDCVHEAAKYRGFYCPSA